MDNKKYVTFGELVVNKQFNPSEDPRVDRIKDLFAEVIDIIDTVESDKDHVNSYVQHAINKVIDTQMIAVKTLFIK